MNYKLPKSYTQLNKEEGFTLIELLVVMGILTTLLAVVIIAINPARQYAQANNTQRRSDVSAILNAVHQYGADNNGDLSGLGIPTGPATNIGSADTDICSDLVTTYLAEMPADPTTGSYTDCTTYDTQYSIAISASDNRITVSAPDAQLSASISMTR